MDVFFRDYGTQFALAIAALNTIISVVISQLFKDSPWARRILVLASVALTVAAVAGSFYSQSQIVASANNEKAHNSMVREGIGKYIKNGDAIMNDFAQNKWPVIEENDWTGGVKGFLLANLKDSYVSRFEDPSGIQPLVITGADTQHNNEYVYMHNRITRLEEFSHELP